GLRRPDVHLDERARVALNRGRERSVENADCLLVVFRIPETLELLTTVRKGGGTGVETQALCVVPFREMAIRPRLPARGGEARRIERHLRLRGPELDVERGGLPAHRLT